MLYKKLPPKVSGSKQQALISQFLEVRNPGLALQGTFGSRTFKRSSFHLRLWSHLRILPTGISSCGYWLSSVPHHMGLPSGLSYDVASSFPQGKQLKSTQEEESRPKWKPWSFYNQIFEVTFHSFGCILFIRSKSESPAPTHEGALPKNVNTRR